MPDPTPDAEPGQMPLPAISPSERSLRAQTAARARWAKPGARERAAEAFTAAGLARHEKIVDPDGRAAELREASATRRLTSPERDELNDIAARTQHSLMAELAANALKASRAASKAAAELKAAAAVTKKAGTKKAGRARKSRPRKASGAK